LEKDLSKKKKKNQKKTLCHSFRIIVIPSVLLSFLSDYCHSFRIIVIPSVLVSFLPNFVIPLELFRELQILTSSKSFPYPKGEKNGHRRLPCMRVCLNHEWCDLDIKVCSESESTFDRHDTFHRPIHHWLIN
jgi:hypothetical protein